MNKTSQLLLLFMLCTPVFITGGCRDTSQATEYALTESPIKVTLQSYQELNQFLLSLEYDRRSVQQQGVPSFELTSIPPDMAQITRAPTKKRLFFLSLLPMALMINEEIQSQRSTLSRILEKLEAGDSISAQEVTSLRALAAEYKITDDPLDDPLAMEKLLRRIDIIPPSLLLAQAANESAYGTSRFARDANNLFGEWTFTPGTGLVPEERPEGERYEVRLFPDLMASLRSYVKNLNTHWAYRDLRLKRQQLRQAGQPLTGLALAAGLELYSERRNEYVDEIRTIIRYNQLHQFNKTFLRQAPSHQQYFTPRPSLTVTREP